MTEHEIEEYLKKLDQGLNESYQHLLEEYALRDESIVVGDGQGGVKKIPARELLAK